VKGRRAEEAIAILSSMKQKAASYGVDLIKHAVANTKKMQGVDVADLYISKLIADGGPQLKRFRAASMGRASPIRKRTSHLTVELDLVKKPEAQVKAASAQSKGKNPKTAAKEAPAAHKPAKVKLPGLKPGGLGGGVKKGKG
jgi:large subunit ribosomal protein L22